MVLNFKPRVSSRVLGLTPVVFRTLSRCGLDWSLMSQAEASVTSLCSVGQRLRQYIAIICFLFLSYTFLLILIDRGLWLFFPYILTVSI